MHFTANSKQTNLNLNFWLADPRKPRKRGFQAKTSNNKKSKDFNKAKV